MANRHSDRKLQLHCIECNTPVTGEHHGCTDAEAILKALKPHEEQAHGSYDPGIRQVLMAQIGLINDGVIALPTTVRKRYRLSAFSD